MANSAMGPLHMAVRPAASGHKQRRTEEDYKTARRIAVGTAIRRIAGPVQGHIVYLHEHGSLFTQKAKYAHGSGGGGGGAVVVHSLQWPFCRPCEQIADPLHSLQWHFRRPCEQISDPPHSLHLLFCRPCEQIADPQKAAQL